MVKTEINGFESFCLILEGKSGNRDRMDYVPEGDQQVPAEGELTLIDSETFYDLLMEQQEQM